MKISTHQFNLVSNLFDFYTRIQQEARKPNAYLLPIRIFLAVGWLRAFAEKAMDPHWLTGETLTQFFNAHLHTGMPFQVYQNFALNVFLPDVGWMAAIVMAGQLLVGLGLLVGLLTPYALLGGMFMNVNFLLSGAPNPSAFYIVLQLVLLMGRAGEVFGLDQLLRRQPRYRQPPLRRRPVSTLRWVSLLCAAIAAGIAIFAFTEIMHFDPGTSVKDAAAVLCVLACVGMGLSLITYFGQADYQRY